MDPQPQQPSLPASKLGIDSLPHEQVLIILCGVVGSGKSTLASAIVRNLPNWSRVCQDDLGDRRACEEMVRFGLAQGKSVIVDRQNFDRNQRKTWLEIARAFPNLKVCCTVMGTHPDECAERLRWRQNHPTVDNPRLALQLLDKFLAMWQEPRLDEGFDWLVRLPQLPAVEDLTHEFLDSLLAWAMGSPPSPAAEAQRQALLGGQGARLAQAQPYHASHTTPYRPAPGVGFAPSQIQPRAWSTSFERGPQTESTTINLHAYQQGPAWPSLDDTRGAPPPNSRARGAQAQTARDLQRSAS
ncbi:hypothetical protein ACM66B_002149 [Microbotryomycetes sp. NB124-2]